MEMAASSLDKLQQLGLDRGHHTTSSQVAPGHTKRIGEKGSKVGMCRNKYF